MDINQAIFNLIQGCEIAQSKGVFSLAEAKVIAESVDFINTVSTSNNEKDKQNKINTIDPTLHKDDGEILST